MAGGALFAQAASTSGMLWVTDPGTHPVWHVLADGVVYVVSGPGEQPLPWLPDRVRLAARSKDTGGLLVVVEAVVATLAPGTAEWTRAVDALATDRLNAPGSADDLRERWAREATVRSFTPIGQPLEEPGRMPTDGGFVTVVPSPATTTGWRPWHAGGRPAVRRRRRGLQPPPPPR